MLEQKLPLKKYLSLTSKTLNFPACLSNLEEAYKRVSKKSSKKKKIEEDLLDGFSDEHFTFIAVYTSEVYLLN